MKKLWTEGPEDGGDWDATTFKAAVTKLAKDNARFGGASHGGSRTVSDPKRWGRCSWMATHETKF